MNLSRPVSRVRSFPLAAAALCVLTAFSALLTAPAVQAGEPCEVKNLSTENLRNSLGLAVKTLASLNASGHKVVALARAGQDLSKYHLRFSHFGFAYQQPDGQGGTVWRVLHKLNQCGTADSAVYRQGLGEFFLGDLWRYEAQWTAFTPEVQERLLALIQNPALSVSMNHKPYSVVSYAWGQKYQQSNQWALETLAAAMEPTAIAGGNTGMQEMREGQEGRRTRAQAWLQFKGYQPTALNIGPLTRLGGRATKANVAFDDHPNEKRFSDRIETVTVDSVFDWLQRSGLARPGQPEVIIY